MAQKITFSTPKRTAVYPYITRADYEYNVEGIFKTKIKMPEVDAAPLMKTITEAANDAFGAKAKSARMPFTKLEDTKEVEFTTKSKFKPTVVDSTGKIIAPDLVPPIYGGSTIKVAGTVYCYNAGGNIGVSLQLSDVQLVELSKGSDVKVSFGEEQGGFVAANDNEAQEADGAAYNF